jgi:diguanylate cyclase (GGDEF)-like protein
MDTNNEKNIDYKEAYEEYKNKFDFLLKSIPDTVLIMNSNGKIINSYDSSDTVVSNSMKTNIGKYPKDIFNSDVAEIVMYNIGKALKTKEIQSFELRYDITSKEAYFEVRIFTSGIDEVNVIIRNTTERVKLERKLNNLGQYDELTKLFNRLSFERKRKKYEDKRFLPLGIIVCDLNNLKSINDTLGHSFGDIAIKKNSDLIREVFNENEITARMGGDEFAIISPKCDNEKILQKINNFKNAIHKYNNSDPKVPVWVSIGYSIRNSLDEKMHDVYVKADVNMYDNKTSNKIRNSNEIVKWFYKLLIEQEENHIPRMKGIEKLMLILLKHLKYKEHEINRMMKFIKYHNIGKIGVKTSGDIRHSEIGYRIAISNLQLVYMADLILKHHESWDGSGFPLGISGEVIPKECRMLSVVKEFYDLRVQNRSLTSTELYKLLRQQSGRKLDPNIVEEFINAYNDYIHYNIKN